MTRNELIQVLNNSSLGQYMNTVAKAVLMNSMTPANGFTKETPEEAQSKATALLLNSVGPAAASSAVEFAINAVKGQTPFKDLIPRLNGSYVNNVRLIQNEVPVGAMSPFTDVLRQFLLPRYAYLDFDNIVDPRHQIDFECGYPKFITPIMYRYMYDRDDVARRVVDIYPDESWAANPEVYETEDESVSTPFEEDWLNLCDNYGLLQFLYRLDRLAGIGHYGALLVGLNDGLDLEQPVNEPDLLLGKRGTVAKKQRELLYVRPFDEYLSFIHEYETDVRHPRYGLPKMYNLVFLDMTIDAAGASIGTRLNRRVHWTRVVHCADNLHSSLVFGIPRMQSVFNRLLDLRKIKGGSAEMFWKGAFPGLSFEIDPRFATDDVDFNEEEFRQKIEEYSDGLRRYLPTLGVSVKSLAPQVADPSGHVLVQMQAIATHFGVPLRVFFGSEEGRLASSQDKLTWNQRLKRRLSNFVEPGLIRNTLDRFIALGVMRPPKKRYTVGWSDLNASTDEDKANLSLKWTQAISQYIGSGVFYLIDPMDYFTMVAGFRPVDAMRIKAYIEANGGIAALKKVFEAQAAGANGKAQNNVSKGERTGTSGSRPAKRNTADKKTEGSSS